MSEITYDKEDLRDFKEEIDEFNKARELVDDVGEKLEKLHKFRGILDNRDYNSIKFLLVSLQDDMSEMDDIFEHIYDDMKEELED